MLKDLLENQNSPASAPIFFVLKKNGELRLVVDYRRFIECTCHNSFNLIRIKKEHKYKTALTCVFEHFEYLVKSFGLQNSFGHTNRKRILLKLNKNFLQTLYLLSKQLNIFMVETDSSNFAIVAILSQTLTKDNKIHPVAFFSRALKQSERNYPIYDKELLSIISTIEYWRHLLKGTDIPFTIFSDQRNLLYQKKPEQMSQGLLWSQNFFRFNIHGP